MPYNHILVAVDLGPEAGLLCHKAIEQAEPGHSRITLLHVIEPIMAMPPYEVPSVFPEGMQQQMVDQAQQRLDNLGRKYQLSEWELKVDIGATKSMILDYAGSAGVDLIVIGSHGRHGFSRLLGSTSNAILHHAECDVLAVRINEEHGTG